MTYFKQIIIVLCISVSLSVQGQINVTGIIKDSKLVKTYENKLYFIDFWATWCAP